MKKNLFLCALLSAITMGNLYSQRRTSTPKLLHCRQIGESTQCTYKVSGEYPKHLRKTSKLYGLKRVPYALCSGALCTQDTRNPRKVICVCPIHSGKGWKGKSVGPKKLSDIRPTRRKNGELATVVSTFSRANNRTPQATGRSTMCSFHNPAPWANCFGVRCKVRNNKAVCSCPIVKTKTFVSKGPLGRAQCTKGIWSAATQQQDKNNNYIMDKMYKK